MSEAVAAASPVGVLAVVLAHGQLYDLGGQLVPFLHQHAEVPDQEDVHLVLPVQLQVVRMAEVRRPDPVGVVRHLLDQVDERVLDGGGQVLDGPDDRLVLVALDGGAQDEEEDHVHLVQRVLGRRLGANAQHVGQPDNQDLSQNILEREEKRDTYSSTLLY